MAQWYYQTGNQQEGPVSMSDLQRLVAEGLIEETDFVKPGADDDWMLASSVEDLFPEDLSNLDPLGDARGDLDPLALESEDDPLLTKGEPLEPSPAHADYALAAPKPPTAESARPDVNTIEGMQRYGRVAVAGDVAGGHGRNQHEDVGFSVAIAGRSFDKRHLIYGAVGFAALAACGCLCSCGFIVTLLWPVSDQQVLNAYAVDAEPLSGESFVKPNDSGNFLAIKMRYSRNFVASQREREVGDEIPIEYRSIQLIADGESFGPLRVLETQAFGSPYEDTVEYDGGAEHMVRLYASKFLGTAKASVEFGFERDKFRNVTGGFVNCSGASEGSINIKKGRQAVPWLVSGQVTTVYAGGLEVERDFQDDRVRYDWTSGWQMYRAQRLSRLKKNTVEHKTIDLLLLFYRPPRAENLTIQYKNGPELRLASSLSSR